MEELICYIFLAHIINVIGNKLQYLSMKHEWYLSILNAHQKRQITAFSIFINLEQYKSNYIDYIHCIILYALITQTFFNKFTKFILVPMRHRFIWRMLWIVFIVYQCKRSIKYIEYTIRTQNSRKNVFVL